MYGGLEMGVQTLVVGHTADGKSTVIKAFLEGAARAGLGAVGYFVEDPSKRTADRFLSTETGIPASSIARLDVGKTELVQLHDAVEGAPWTDRVLVNFGPVDAQDVLEHTRSTHTIGGAPLGLVAVDYAQALSGEGGLEEVCANMSRSLQVIAEARGIAAVLGSQASSEVLKRGKDRYQRDGTVDGFTIGIGEAMWSRRMEQYSKAVLTVIRPGRWRRLMGEDSADDTIEVHVPKSNFGPSGGHVTFGWDGSLSRIYSRKGAR